MTRLRSTSLIVVTRQPISVGCLGLRRLSGSSERGTARFPGCLTT